MVKTVEAVSVSLCRLCPLEKADADVVVALFATMDAPNNATSSNE